MVHYLNATASTIEFDSRCTYTTNSGWPIYYSYEPPPPSAEPARPKKRTRPGHPHWLPAGLWERSGQARARFAAPPLRREATDPGYRTQGKR